MTAPPDVPGVTRPPTTQLEGTHTGPMPSPDGTEIPPTGRQVSIPFVAMHDVRGEKLTMTRFYFDQMEMISQLGLAGG